MADTLTKTQRYLKTVRGEPTDRPPVWIMRQAGRYMPEYQELRARHSFLDLCLDPQASARATLLAGEILDVDILIIFNDILVPLQSMGLDVEFTEKGPRINNPVASSGDLARLRTAVFQDPPVARALRLVRETTGPAVPVLGFCGSPFTLAVYAVEGEMSRGQDRTRTLMFRQPGLLKELLERLTDMAGDYLAAQIREGGADGVQVFESWGGVLAMPHHYEEFAAAWQKRLIGRIKREFPRVPVHLYVRGSNGRVAGMAATGADVLGLDWMTPLAEARRLTGAALQGNLDPVVMTTPGAVEGELHRALDSFDWRRGWIANLGHGITPAGTVAAARRFVEAVRALPSSA
jgi:uroporphyrinogen decarboxylase